MPGQKNVQCASPTRPLAILVRSVLDSWAVVKLTPQKFAGTFDCVGLAGTSMASNARKAIMAAPFRIDDLTPGAASKWAHPALQPRAVADARVVQHPGRVIMAGGGCAGSPMPSIDGAGRPSIESSRCPSP